MEGLRRSPKRTGLIGEMEALAESVAAGLPSASEICARGGNHQPGVQVDAKQTGSGSTAAVTAYEPNAASFRGAGAPAGG